VVSVRELHVAVVEFFVAVRDAARGKLLDEHARSEVKVPLVLDPAVDEEEPERAERSLVASDEARGIPREPSRPDVLAQAARAKVEGQRDAELTRGIGRIRGGHRKAVAHREVFVFLARALLELPEERADAAGVLDAVEELREVGEIAVVDAH